MHLHVIKLQWVRIFKRMTGGCPFVRFLDRNRGGIFFFQLSALKESCQSALLIMGNGSAEKLCPCTVISIVLCGAKYKW